MYVMGFFGVSGYQIVLFRAQGPGLWRMYLFPGAPNMRGKFIVIIVLVVLMLILVFSLVVFIVI
jgi:hypothetical protein